MFTQIFNILFDAGAFPVAPDSVRIPADKGFDIIPPPKVVFTSRLALAMRMVENNAIDRTLERLAMIAQFVPDVLLNFNMDELARIAARNDGVPENVLVLKKEVDEMKQAQAEQQQQMAQMEQAESMAGTAKTVGDTNMKGVEQITEMMS